MQGSSSNQHQLTSMYQAEAIKKINETKQYTLMATALLEKIVTDSCLTPGAAKLWEYLYTKAVMDHMFSVKIKYKDLAEKFFRSERTMKRYVDNLKENGYLHVESNFHYHGQRANTFYLRIPENILKLIEQVKDRNKVISKKEFSNQNKTFVEKKYQKNQNIDKLRQDSATLDICVTPDHDTNVTLNNNIKKDILINNNNVVVDLTKEETNKIKSMNRVLHGTNDQKEIDDDNIDHIRIKEIDKTLNALYIKLGQTTGKKRVDIFDEIKILQAKMTTIHVLMKQKQQSVQVLVNTQKLPHPCSTNNFSQIKGKRELSEPDIARIKKSIRNLIDENYQHRICNEVIYAIRFGALRIAQGGGALSIPHAISIALKLIREKRWETPMLMPIEIKNIHSQGLAP